MRPPGAPRRPTPNTKVSPRGRRITDRRGQPAKAQAVGSKNKTGINVYTPTRPSNDAAAVLGSKKDNKSEIQIRRTERRRSKRRLVWYRVGAAVAAVLAVVAVVGIGWFSPLFAVRDGSIRVTAENGEIDLASVTEIVNEQVGRPLPVISTAALETRILENPAIGRARVTRDWPGGLNVVVEPRVPRMALKDGDKFQLVGEDGVAVTVADEVPPELFVVEVPGKTAVNSEQTAQILAFWNQLSEPLRAQVAVVRFSSGHFTLELQGGALIIWGSDQEANTKNDVLSLLMQQRPSAVYDVSDPRKPSVR